MSGGDQESIAISSSSSTTSDAHLNSLLCSLSLLNHKLNHLQSMVTLISAQGASSSCSMSTLSGMSTLIQEIMVTASTMIFNCQQLPLKPSTAATTTGNHISPTIHSQDHMQDNGPQFAVDTPSLSGTLNLFDDVIIEIEASELVAKYTNYCQVCGKGFQRDANLRMHMRAHGDEYKSNAALSNPIKNANTKQGVKRKYSCPHEGCRWNKKHDKFQPLKSMVCVKNHYKRSHCPKMYVCKRCNRKRFSVLSDLRTHEKHCGDGIKWRCSCGTTFSRKDKLMGHVALFVGHSPVVLGDGSDGSAVVNALT